MIGSDTQITSKIQRRREVVFLILAGLFLGSMVMLNILGVSRFIDLSYLFGISDDSRITFSLAVGVLPYPITFLCTDFISELYGRERANRVVWVGLLLNIWILFIFWLGGILNPPISLNEFGKIPLEVNGNQVVMPNDYLFYELRSLTFSATFASMIAYLAAQFCDVHIFHWLKKKTNGSKLWLRNNVSTLISQLVDSVAVILITHFLASGIPLNNTLPVSEQLFYFILSAYLFKVFVALLDTIPFYLGVFYFKKYLNIKNEIV